MTTVSDAIDVPAGLKGVVVAETALGDVRGREGFYHYRQYSAVELAQQRGLEDVWHLMFEARCPTRTGAPRWPARWRPRGTCPAAVRDALPAIAAAGGGPLDGLRTALSLLGSARGLAPVYDVTPAQRRQDALGLAAAVPTILAALHRLGRGSSRSSRATTSVTPRPTWRCSPARSRRRSTRGPWSSTSC